MWPFSSPYRSGSPTRLGPVAGMPDPHRWEVADAEHMGILPPSVRDWGQYQTYFRGNQYPSFRLSQQYTYTNGAYPHYPQQNTLRGGSISQQIGAVSVARLLDKMRAAWASR